MAGYRVRVWFDADGLGVGEPARDNGVLELPVIPQPGMELADDEGRVATIRRVVLLASPDPDGAVAVLVCAPG
ncbi:hypothetical protein GCM10010964_33180 [Caldovatus sediminis]|uniref:Uncharacterized protein n=1 Tax=Caldovatus sediminis TaxID=2041189 RepID=A0A8J2ZE25_9PROT|nr:hypothetical protein [Caldovatus sediminis]GGG43107.1 hypothetical protein GCM10010964_33180 [Caldovatus sediminis]